MDCWTEPPRPVICSWYTDHNPGSAHDRNRSSVASCPSAGIARGGSIASGAGAQAHLELVAGVPIHITSVAATGTGSEWPHAAGAPSRVHRSAVARDGWTNHARGGPTYRLRSNYPHHVCRRTCHARFANRSRPVPRARRRRHYYGCGSSPLERGAVAAIGIPSGRRACAGGPVGRWFCGLRGANLHRHLCCCGRISSHRIAAIAWRCRGRGVPISSAPAISH